MEGKGTGFQTKQKYVVLAAGAFAIFFTGYPHIWSLYQPYAMEAAGWTQAQASLCFYIYFITFVIGNIVGGRIQDRHGPRPAIIWGGGIFTAGILLSAAALRPSPLFMYLTYGVLQGFGQGMIYTTIISTAQKWFREKTGFASGVIVTANGLCGFFMAPISRKLLEHVGISRTFLLVGACIGVSWILGSIFIKSPSEQEEGSIEYTGRQYKAAEMLRTKMFYFVFLTMLFGLIPYLLVSPFSQTIQLERGIGASVAVLSVMAGSVFNAAARLAIPSIADKVGRIICVKVVLLAAAAAMLLLAGASPYITPAVVVLVYACYGGIMGSFPSLCSGLFGMKYSGENYGFVMFGIGAATLLSPVITNGTLKIGFTMETVFLIGAFCAVAAFISLMLLEKEIDGRKRRGNGYTGYNE